MQYKQTIEEANRERRIKKGEGVIGKTWQDGVLIETTDLSSGSLSNGLCLFATSQKYDSVLSIPIFYQDELRSVVAFYK